VPKRWARGTRSAGDAALIVAVGAIALSATFAYAGMAGVGGLVGSRHAQHHLAASGGIRAPVYPRDAPPGPPRPRIEVHPDVETSSTLAAFSVTDRSSDVHFRCRLDAAGWKKCGRRSSYGPLAVGQHEFSVRAVDRKGRRSQPTRFGWRILAAQTGGGVSFSVRQAAAPEPMYPGGPAVALPLTLENSNNQPIHVTSLTVEVTGTAPGCDGATNISVIPSTASGSTPVTVPANGSVSLPAQGVSAPALQLLDLPFNQDACQGASFDLSFAGSAYG